MIRGLREEQRRSPGPLADGLQQWLRGEDTIEAEVAGSIVAELITRGLHKLTPQNG